MACTFTKTCPGFTVGKGKSTREKTEGSPKAVITCAFILILGGSEKRKPESQGDENKASSSKIARKQTKKEEAEASSAEEEQDREQREDSESQEEESEASEQKKKLKKMPRDWRWISDVFSNTDAHLPEGFLPRDWNKTAMAHARQAYDPDSKQIYDLTTKYEFYHNDIHNLWLICNACNNKKTNKETMEWLAYQWAYGSNFIDHLKSYGVDERSLFTQNRHKLAAKVTEWFFSNHAHYLNKAHQAFENIDQPLLLLGEQVDEAKIARSKHATCLEAYEILCTGIAAAAVNLPQADIESELPKNMGKQETRAFLTALSEETQQGAGQRVKKMFIDITRKARRAIEAQREEAHKGKKSK